MVTRRPTTIASLRWPAVSPVWRSLLAWPLLAGCTAAMPTTADGCAALTSPATRDECFLAILPGIFKVDPVRGIALTESSVVDPATRDFVWLTVTRDVDPNSEKYCNRIVDPLLKERCKVLVARPHLHRSLLDGKGPPMSAHGVGGSGGPPMLGAPPQTTGAPPPVETAPPTPPPSAPPPTPTPLPSP